MSQVSQNSQNINREETKESFTTNKDVPGSKANFEQKKDFFEKLNDVDNKEEMGGSSVGNEQGQFEGQTGSIGSQGNLTTGTPGGSNLLSNLPSGTSVSKDSSVSKDTTSTEDSKSDTSESKLQSSERSSDIPTPPPQPELNDKGEIKNVNTYGQGKDNNIPSGTSLNEKKDTNLDTNDSTGKNQQFGKDFSGEQQELYKKDEWNKGELSAGKHWDENKQFGKDFNGEEIKLSFPSSDKKLDESDKNVNESNKDFSEGNKGSSGDSHWGNRDFSESNKDSSGDKDWSNKDFSEGNKDFSESNKGSSGDSHWGNKDFSESNKDTSGDKNFSERDSSETGLSGSESFNKDK